MVLGRFDWFLLVVVGGFGSFCLGGFGWFLVLVTTSHYCVSIVLKYCEDHKLQTSIIIYVIKVFAERSHFLITFFWRNKNCLKRK